MFFSQKEKESVRVYPPFGITSFDESLLDSLLAIV